jgi:tetratricopeptide (TPR) repeat protein
MTTIAPPKRRGRPRKYVTEAERSAATAASKRAYKDRQRQAEIDAARAARVIPRCCIEQVLGDTHPHTLAARNNLASAYQAAGRLAEAIPLFERTLADRERVLGETHPDTLAARNDLASAYKASGG